MVSEEECIRTVERGNCYAIVPMLPEVSGDKPFTPRARASTRRQRT